MTERGTILVVDDDEDVRETIRDYFEHCGFEVHVAGDGDAMRKILATRRIDLVMMDLNLPGTDGLALTRELRAQRDIGIVMLTAAGQVVDRIIGLEMGADDYVAKPFEPRELLARVKSVLRRQGKGSPAATTPAAVRPRTLEPSEKTFGFPASPAGALRTPRRPSAPLSAPRGSGGRTMRSEAERKRGRFPEGA